jgi:hypothetical protein
MCSIIFVNCPEKALKGKNCIRSDGSHDSQTGGWTSGEAGNCAQTKLAQGSYQARVYSDQMVFVRQYAGLH